MQRRLGRLLHVVDADAGCELAKHEPGRLNFASGSTGSASHLAGEMLKAAARVDMVHVPYKGGGPALQRPGRPEHR